MKIANYKEMKLEPVNMEGAKDANIRWLIAEEDGAPNFAMRLFELKAGGYSPLHSHPYEHEVYALEGEGTLVFEGKEYQFKKEYCIFVPPDKEHQFKNTGKSTLKFLCCIPHSCLPTGKK